MQVGWEESHPASAVFYLLPVPWCSSSSHDAPVCPSAMMTGTLEAMNKIIIPLCYFTEVSVIGKKKNKPDSLAWFFFCCCDRTAWPRHLLERRAYLGLWFQRASVHNARNWVTAATNMTTGTESWEPKAHNFEQDLERIKWEEHMVLKHRSLFTVSSLPHQDHTSQALHKQLYQHAQDCGGECPSSLCTSFLPNYPKTGSARRPARELTVAASIS